MIVLWIIIGFIIGVVASEVVDECCSDSLLWYMTLPFAYVLRPIWRAVRPLLRHPRLWWWYTRHGLSPYCDLEEIYKLNDDDWNELMMFVTSESRKEWLDEQRDNYKNGKGYWIVEHEGED